MSALGNGEDLAGRAVLTTHTTRGEDCTVIVSRRCSGRAAHVLVSFHGIESLTACLSRAETDALITALSRAREPH